MDNEFLQWAVAHACIGIGSYVTAQLVRQSAKKNDKKVKKLQSKHVYAPNELLAQLKAKYYQPYQQGQIREVDCGKFFLSGVVGFPSNQLMSLDDKKYLVHSTTEQFEVKIKVVQNRNIKQFRELQSVQTDDVQHFYLSEKDPAFEVQSNHVQIEDFDSTRKSNALKEVATYDKINHDDFGKVYSVAAGTALTVGIQKNQLGIELGDRIITYGKVILDLEQMKIIFRSPKYFLKSKSQLINTLKGDSIGLKILGLLLLGYSIFEVYKIMENLYGFCKDKLKGKKDEK